MRIDRHRCLLREVLGEPDGLGTVVGSSRRAIATIPTLAGRLFPAGLSALGRSDEPLGELWHACSVLRENRGDGHVAADVVAGLDGQLASRRPLGEPVAGHAECDHGAHPGTTTSPDATGGRNEHGPVGRRVHR